MFSIKKKIVFVIYDELAVHILICLLFYDFLYSNNLQSQ